MKFIIQFKIPQYVFDSLAVVEAENVEDALEKCAETNHSFDPKNTESYRIQDLATITELFY